MDDQLSKVLENNLCAGCGGCAAVAPEAVHMRIVQDGFARPMFWRDLQPDERTEIADICPSVAQDSASNGRKFDAMWGPYVSVETGFSTDDALRNKAASGGALSGFLKGLLASGYVDGVIQIKADPQDPLANVTCVSFAGEDIDQASGSRYAPSSPLDILPQLRGDGRRYAFVGKPCDVSALRAMQRFDPEIAKMAPVLISFFCAGVPSLTAGAELLAQMSVERDEVMQFQHRAEGWPGRATAFLRNGGKASMSYDESWGNVLSKAVQHRCKICADGSGVFADVVFADAWEADADGYPSFSDRPGQSLVLARTDLGRDLITAAKVSGHLKLSEYALDNLVSAQPGQTRRRRVLLARLAALWVSGHPIPRYRGMGLLAMARRASVLESVRNFGGMLRRSMRFKRSEEGSC